MFLKKVTQLKKINSFDLGQNSFLIGTFFLASALPISIIFYLLSIIIFFKNKTISFTRDLYNQLLLISTGIMILSTINSINNIKAYSSDLNLDIWINLFNWIPLFLFFITYNYSEPLIKFIYQRGEFTIVDSLKTAYYFKNMTLAIIILLPHLHLHFYSN